MKIKSPVLAKDGTSIIQEGEYSVIKISYRRATHKL